MNVAHVDRSTAASRAPFQLPSCGVAKLVTIRTAHQLEITIGAIPEAIPEANNFFLFNKRGRKNTKIFPCTWKNPIKKTNSFTLSGRIQHPWLPSCQHFIKTSALLV
jgi:hypothetical protein